MVVESTTLKRLTRGWNFFALASFWIVTSAQTDALATPYLVADADSGQVLIENEATSPWYPAALTKLMTVYVVLDAVRAGKLTLDTPLVMSAHAAEAQPLNMGFQPGSEVTLDNALKMMMVKSANDVAVMIAEGVSGSVEAFADDMNAAGRRLGLHNSHFVTSNGLHEADEVTSARDMAIIARGLFSEFPEHTGLYGIGALQLGVHIISNENELLGRYPGADGMKTGFTCQAGFNVVATANHYGRRLIVVVLGAPSAKLRTEEAADLFNRGFVMRGGSVSLQSLPSLGGDPPNLSSDVCLHRGAEPVAVDRVANLSTLPPHFDPVPIFVGPAPGWRGPVLGPRDVGGAPLAGPIYGTTSVVKENLPQTKDQEVPGSLRGSASQQSNAQAIPLIVESGGTL